VRSFSFEAGRFGSRGRIYINYTLLKQMIEQKANGREALALCGSSGVALTLSPEAEVVRFYLIKLQLVFGAKTKECSPGSSVGASGVRVCDTPLEDV
jgi:hypothetical protein